MIFKTLKSSFQKQKPQQQIETSTQTYIFIGLHTSLPEFLQWNLKLHVFIIYIYISIQTTRPSQHQYTHPLTSPPMFIYPCLILTKNEHRKSRCVSWATSLVRSVWLLPLCVPLVMHWAAVGHPKWHLYRWNRRFFCWRVDRLGGEAPRKI